MDKRHTHSMEPMSMGAGVPGLFYMQHIFWAFVGTAIAVAALANAINMALYYQRLKAASHRMSQPAKPNSFFFQSHATLSSIIRELGYYSTPVSVRKFRFYLPPMGPVIMMVGYIVLIVVCSLYGFDTADFLQWENIGYRTGFIAVAQIPLIVLLAGKRNLIGFFTGLGYERLNWLHRWVARSLLFTILMHMGFWMTEWGKYDYIMVKLKTDYLTQIGMAAFSILAWLVLSSVAPIRGLSYEFFVIQHIISYLGFLVAVYFHVPDENRIWVWLPLGFWAFDRVVRAAFLVYNNCSLFHKTSSGILACKATFEPLDGSHTRVTIANPPMVWQAGQHLFLTCHTVAPLTSHPFTIASLPSDGKIEFIVRAKKGSTKKFFKHAEKAHPTHPATAATNTDRSVLIDGPYGRVRPLRQFDSLLFIAGSTGATFTMPLMRDVVEQWTNPIASRFNLVPAGAVTRHIRFIWVVKHSSAINWFKSQLQKITQDVEALRNEGHDVAVKISIYVTCDDTITSGQSSINGDNVNRFSNSNSFASATDEKNTEANILSRTSSITSLPPQNPKCCCTKTISEDGTSETPQAPCYCSHIPTLSKSISTTTSKPSTPSYNHLAGRPNIENLIRKTAEIALGEMAVIVCGPPGLVQGTRNSVVKISDDRAVHRGTGAQGIYVHAETFGYA